MIRIMVVLLLLFAEARSQTIDMPLYNGPFTGPDEEVHSYDPVVDSLVKKVSRPVLTAYLPARRRDKSKAVIICPGGGYHTLLIEREGRRVAEAFKREGIAAFVLKYRLPSNTIMEDRSTAPLQDAQQAIRMVRKNAKKWHIDPHAIGIMGFSAGGHLAATAGTHLKGKARPDFMILVYPVISLTDSIGHIGSRNNLLGKDATAEKIREFSNEFHVTANTPPAFITHAKDDEVVLPANSLLFHALLKQHGVPSELLLYEQGGHGYLQQPAFEEWFARCVQWVHTTRRSIYCFR